MNNERLEYFNWLVRGRCGRHCSSPLRARTARKVGGASGRANRVADAPEGGGAREQTAEVLGGRMDHYLGRDEEVAWRKVAEMRGGPALAPARSCRRDAEADRMPPRVDRGEYRGA